MRSSSALRQQLTRSIGPLALGQELTALSGLRLRATEIGDQPQPNMGSAEEPKGRCCCYIYVEQVLLFNAQSHFRSGMIKDREGSLFRPYHRSANQADYLDGKIN